MSLVLTNITFLFCTSSDIKVLSDIRELQIPVRWLPMSIIRDYQFQGTAILMGQKCLVHIEKDQLGNNDSSRLQGGFLYFACS